MLQRSIAKQRTESKDGYGSVAVVCIKILSLLSLAVNKLKQVSAPSSKIGHSHRSQRHPPQVHYSLLLPLSRQNDQIIF